MDRIILHCDLNSFYASVELRSRPDLQNVPVAVCGDPPSRHGIILAKNEPAKKFGVQTAETIWQAKKKCPELVLLPPHHKLYRQGSQEVNTIYESYPDINLGVAPYIVSDNWDGGRYTPTGSWAYAATSKATDLEAATELVKWMSGVDSGIRLFEKTKNMPSTYEAYESIDLFEEDENYKALYEQLRDYGHPRPHTPVYPQVSTSFQQALESVGLSGKDAQEEVDKSVERIDAKLKRYVR